MTIRDASPTSTSSTLSNITVQTEKHVEVRAMSSASPSISTPPTSLDDEYSVLSDAAKAEPLAEAFESVHPPRAADDAPEPSNSTPEMPPSEGRRSARSSRKSVTTYNVQILAGTAIHTPTKYLEKHHKNVLHGSVEGTPSTVDVTSVKKRAPKTKSAPADVDDPVEEQLVTEAAQAARRRTSSRVTDLRKEALRNITGVGQAVANALSDGRTLVQNSLRNAALDNSRKATQTKRPHAATEDGEQTEAGESRDDKVSLKPKAKVWLRQGLYIGQHRDFDPRLSESQNRAKKRVKRLQDANVLPLPMFAAERMLNEDLHHVFRDFKLPFDTYNPLPRKVKVDGWVKLNKSRFRFWTQICMLLTRCRQVHWRRFSTVETRQAGCFPVLLRPRRWLWRCLSQSHNGLRMRRHKLPARTPALREPSLRRAQATCKRQPLRLRCGGARHR